MLKKTSLVMGALLCLFLNVFILSKDEGRTYLGAARMVYGTSYATSKVDILYPTICRGEDTSEFQYPLSWWGITGYNCRFSQVRECF